VAAPAVLARLLGRRHARLGAAASALVLALGLAACGGSGGQAPGSALDVVAGFYPLAFAAEEVGGAGVAVVNLTPPGAEPHDLELEPRDVERVRAADLVLYLGGGFQPALEAAALESQGPVDLLEGLELRENGDPHVWLDPLRYAAIVERLGRMLQAEDRAAALVARLRELDAEFERGLADCQRRALVTSHEAFAYLAERFQLEQIAVAGIEPEAEPAPGDLARVVERVRELGATTIYVEPLVSPELAETVAREADVEVATLNPLEGLTEEQLAAGEDYFSVMRENLAALREGLGCR
jgi:zinc transport system substrate-binding protein